MEWEDAIERLKQVCGELGGEFRLVDEGRAGEHAVCEFGRNTVGIIRSELGLLVGSAGKGEGLTSTTVLPCEEVADVREEDGLACVVAVVAGRRVKFCAGKWDVLVVDEELAEELTY